MPNSSGVFYKDGKFHISKLTTDLVAFAGQVEATGIVLADSQETGSVDAQGNSTESIVLPTATQVVDYVQNVSNNATTYSLDAGSASSAGGEAFAYTTKPDTDSEKKRLDDMFIDFADLIAQAASSSEARDNAIEASAGLEANGSYAQHSGSNYIDGGATLKAVDLLLDGQAKANADAIAAETSRAMLAEQGIQAELDATQVGAGLQANGAYSAHGASNYLAGAADLHGADLLLDTQAKQNADDIAAEITDRQNADALLRSDVDAALGVTVPNFSVTASGLATDNGYNTAFNGAGDVKVALEALDSAIFAMLSGSSVNLDNLKELVDAYEAMDSDVFGMVSGIHASSGMYSVPVLAADGVSNEVISLSYEFQSDGVTPEAVAPNYLANASFGGSVTLKKADMLLDAAIKANADGLAQEIIDRTNADSAIQSELDLTQASAGVNPDGSWTASAGMDYIGGATSLKNATEVLDGALKSEETARLAADGSLTFSYAGATAADLTAAINEVASIQSSAHTTNQAELDATQLALGFDAPNAASAVPAERDGYHMGLISAPAATGSYVKIFLDHPASSTIPSIVSSIMTKVQDMSEAFEQEDIDLNTLCSDLQSELDATQTGAGLAADGSYTTHAVSNYLATASSLHDADSKLDTRAKANADAIAQEIIDRSSADADHLARFNRIYAGAGLDTAVGSEGNFLASTFTSFTAQVGTASGSDIKTSIEAIDGALAASQVEIFDSAGSLSAAFNIDGASYSTIESAINAIGGAIGDADLDISGENATNGSVDLATQTMSFAGAASGNTLMAATQNIEMEASGQSVSAKLKPEISVDRVNAQNGRISVIGMDIVVQHEPFVASEAISFGDVLCVDKTSANFGVKRADISDSDKLAVIGIAFDRSSTSGVIDPTGAGFAVADNVAIVVSRQNVQGLQLDSSVASDYAVGDALYLSTGGMITKEIPADDPATAFDAKAVYAIGFVTKAGSGQKKATECAIWFDPRLVAMEA